MRLTLEPRGLRRFLFLTGGVVMLAGLAVETAYYTGGQPEGLHRWVEFFSLSFEQNLPTWYSSLLLGLCGATLALVALDASRYARGFVPLWWLLAAGFGYISLDEAVSIHEGWVGWSTAGGVFYFSWVVPASCIVLVLLVVYARFLVKLPGASRDAFVLSGFLYVGGAVGMEFFLGYWTELNGSDNLGYALIDFIEESLEITGLTLFLPALFEHLERVQRAP